MWLPTEEKIKRSVDIRFDEQIMKYKNNQKNS